MKRGENKVFAQLLITSVFYIMVNSFYEIVIFIDNRFAGFIALLQLLAVFNYLPEMSLSFLFIVDTIHADRIMRNCMAPRREVQRITVIKSTSV
ncbi:hypothetical protein GCK72_020246 [Caenorhabditis remanei]|uniref:Uncharacterized protein n=1 Tax=Caenorhabditis remanei TaxID=31234 RepID=A0A6A5GGX4_CAERE|nr:hypothetical protein GCK72_020246 [Caenorhabditis remanei]KAF1753689.1 hypothetical protein GCK72_020246 [Caenorhabditis remanei]